MRTTRLKSVRGRSTFLSKRKRQQISHHMVEAAQLSIQAELSCIHALDAPEGRHY